MRRTISVFLTFALLLTCLIPAFSAAAANYTVPISNEGKRVVVMLSGDGDALYDKDGNRLFKFTDMLTRINNATELNKDEDDEDDEDDNTELFESIANVLMPFLLQGMLHDDWEPYYENLQKEIAELTEGLQLDENGNVVNGSGISPQRAATNLYNTTHENKNGPYNSDSYHFWYDWRKDPLESADELHTYLEKVRAMTGKQEVSLLGRCLGNNVIAAYIYKYGLDGIAGVGIDGTVSYGAEFISESISGKFHVDGKAIERLLNDSNSLGRMHLDPFILATLSLATFFTMPCYWACVKPADFEDAKNYVFGPEGSEKRQQYAGLIKKIDNYHYNVRANMDSILRSIPKNGKKIAVISKYGFQIVPICQSSACVSDQYASVASSSFGATTSDIFTRLDEDYINTRIAEGKGKYISPDKMIDASTCLFPDNTWFTKNISHSVWTWTENALLYTVITADRQYTVDDLVTTQFMVQDENGNIVPMTADNCDTERWEVKEENNSGNEHVHRVLRFLASFITWIKYLAAFVKAKLAK